MCKVPNTELGPLTSSSSSWLHPPAHKCREFPYACPSAGVPGRQRPVGGGVLLLGESSLAPIPANAYSNSAHILAGKPAAALLTPDRTFYFIHVASS